MCRRYELDQHKEEIIYLYLNKKLSCKDISINLGYSLSGIYDALKRWDIKTRNVSDSHKKYACDENYFYKINSEQKAYWLGFIYADGYITNNNLGIALSIKDKNHLVKFKRNIKATYPINTYLSNSIYKSIEYCRILLQSEKLVKDIRDNGVLNNKSLILQFPGEDILNEKYYKHFIRGYFDGDGSLVLSKNSINFKIYGTKQLLTKFISIFNKNSSYEFKYKLFKRWDNEKNNYYLSYGGRYKTLSIMNYLYDDATIYLDRKYEKFKKLKYMK